MDSYLNKKKGLLIYNKDMRPEEGDDIIIIIVTAPSTTVRLSTAEYLPLYITTILLYLHDTI